MKKIIFAFLTLSVLAFGTSLVIPPPPPPGPIGPYLNGAFPDTSPNTSWDLEDPFPDFKFKDPLRLLPFSGTNDHLLLCKSGEVWRVSFENKIRDRLLDIRDRTFDGSEGGAVGMVLHPGFGDPAQPDKQFLFLFYRYKPNPGDWEEISLIDKGDNLQWPYKEGTHTSPFAEKPATLIGNEKPPYYDYGRSMGSCIIGGGVYRGAKYPQLKDKYLFGDWRENKIWAIEEPGGSVPPKEELLVETINTGSVELPENPRITGIFMLENGEIIVSVMTYLQQNTGKIYRLIRKSDAPPIAEKLSELGAFSDLATLEPAPGLILYDVNAPLWSDRALKKRWMALPNDGQYNSPEEQISFSRNGEWTFPPGTVFVKHFELPTTTDPAGPAIRLETRFFVIDKNGLGYGLTYKWNEDGTEAFLLEGGAKEDFDIMENGSVAFTQTWDFPSRDQCLSCHNHSAAYVLDVKTHQLNGDLASPVGSILVTPGDHSTSELWLRDASLSGNRMPPLAHNLIDEPYIDALAEWIDGLDEDSGKLNELLVYPNPTADLVNVKVSDDWQDSFTAVLYSANGQVLFRINNPDRTLQFDLTNYPAGYYLLEISGGGNKHVQKIIRQ